MKKTTIYTILLFTGSVAVSGILAESWMRLSYEPTPTFDINEIADSFGKYVYTPPKNALGFREAELQDDVFQDNYRRILFLGDSFTFGRGVENGEDRFSDIIETRLNQKSLESGFKYHIYNAGKSGTEPKKWVRHLKTLLPIYQPQYVVAVFFLRDGTNLCTSLLCHKKRIEKLKAKYENTFWYRYSYIGKYIGNSLVERRFASYYLKKMKQSYLGNEDEQQPWIEQQEYLREIRNICRDREIEFRLVIFPLLFDLESGYQFYDVENEITRFSEQNSIPVFSLTKGFIGKESKSLWVSPSDQHPNEKGHLIAADTLYPYLRNSLEF